LAKPFARVDDLTLLNAGTAGGWKSMLAARLPGILPPLEPAEASGIR
jgi:predicted ATPase with chaperone activity